MPNIRVNQITEADYARSEPNGFVDRVATLSWTDTSPDRTLTITGAHTVWCKGQKYIKATDTKQISTDVGLHFVYYNDSGVLSESTVWPGFDSCLLATVYWNGTNGLIGDERHGIKMDAVTHEYLHETVGTRFETGLTGSFADATFSIAVGEWWDEDIKFSTAAPTTTARVLYKDGSANWTWTAAQAQYYLEDGSSDIRYNNGNALASAGANEYVAYWFFATNEPSTPFVALMGQRKDTTLASARANNTYEGLSFGTLPFKEMKVLYRVILRNTATPYIEAQDLRTISNLPAGTYVATLHSSLTGLSNDDHTIYAKLTGRSGGQTIQGSTDASENLTLESTANGTKGTVIVLDPVLKESSGVIQRQNSAGKAVLSKIAVVQTTDATVTDIATIAVAEGSTYFVEASIVGRKSDGSQNALYVLKGLFYRNAGGNVTQQGNTIVEEIESDSDWNADLVADTGNQTIDVRVTGKAATTVDWKVDVRYFNYN